MNVVKDMLLCFYRYDTSFLDYFYLDFYEKSHLEKATYTSTWYMYNFQKRLNNTAFLTYFKDKKKFYQKFKNFVNHSHFLPNKENKADFIKWLDDNEVSAIMVKSSDGQVGKGISKFKVTREGQFYFFNEFNIHKFYDFLFKNNLDLIENFISQHQVLQNISPQALSTIRVITVVDVNGNVKIEGAILRMSVDKIVDNFDAGGVSAFIDVFTGIIQGSVKYKDPRQKEYLEVHPVTLKKVTGLQLPFWEEVTQMILKAAKLVPEVRTVGWDVVITNSGPFLLEGNHNWDKTHWQKSYGKGLKKNLEIYV